MLGRGMQDELEEYAQKLRGTTGLSTLAKGYKVWDTGRAAL